VRLGPLASDNQGEGIVMELIRIGRRALATLVIASLFAVSGSAIAGDRDVHTDPGVEKSSPPVLDLLMLRPAGILALVTGTALFIAPVMPLTLITRPSEMGRPFHGMVVKPAHYVFVDPLGEH
jgi:hypothetical protein